MKTINKFFLTTWCVFFFMQAHAQVGARVKYNTNSFSAWEGFTDSEGGDIDFFPSNLEVGIDYWFRLKNYRIEFTPELGYGLSSTTKTSITESNFSYFSFLFNTQIYAFDLEGDCDCPTFSKQGPTLNKGLFFNLSPGIMYSFNDVVQGDTETYNSTSTSFRLGLGLGYDIGINDLITITPMVSYFINTSLSHEPIPALTTTIIETPSLETGLNQLQFQIRVGFRPDYVKSYGRR